MSLASPQVVQTRPVLQDLSRLVQARVPALPRVPRLLLAVRPQASPLVELNDHQLVIGPNFGSGSGMTPMPRDVGRQIPKDLCGATWCSG